MVQFTVETVPVAVMEQRKLLTFGWIVTSKNNHLEVLMRLENGIISHRNVSTVDFGLENLGGISIKSGGKIETFAKKRDENGFSYMEKI